MNVLVRVDASESRGAGHLMRCLALGHALREQRAAVSFACRRLPSPAQTLVRERGFEVLELQQPGADAQATLAAIGQRRLDWIVVDHYELDAGWERELHKAARSLLAIDDLADRPHACEVLLDQNLREDQGAAYDARLPAGCERLLGPRYALLDASFARERTAPHRGEREGLLIAFGGGDALRLTTPVLRAVLERSTPGLRIDVVVGALNSERRAVDEVAAGATNVRVHHATRDMATLMARAAVYVGSGGSTSWERCCAGLPGAVVAVVEHQEPVCAALDQAGTHIYLGPAAGVTPQALAHAALALLAAPALRSRLAQRSAALVDGNGAARVAARMCAGEVRIREAGSGDSDVIRQWRNHPEVRRQSGSETEITRNEHKAWFAQVLADPDRHLLIGEDEEGTLGVLRYDVAQNAARVSIYLTPERLGTGAGTRLLAAGERWMVARRPDVRTLQAQVRAGNHRSFRLFADGGYRLGESLLCRELPRMEAN